MDDRRWISLNVGGGTFMTSRATLTKSTPPNSPLHRISCNSTKVDFDRDQKGAYLIDRDPTYFQVVLNFLRHGRLVLKNDIPEEAILIEAEYFNLPELIKVVRQRMNCRHRLIRADNQAQQAMMMPMQPQFRALNQSWQDSLASYVNKILEDDTVQSFKA